MRREWIRWFDAAPPYFGVRRYLKPAYRDAPVGHFRIVIFLDVGRSAVSLHDMSACPITQPP